MASATFRVLVHVWLDPNSREEFLLWDVHASDKHPNTNEEKNNCALESSVFIMDMVYVNSSSNELG